MFNFLKNIGPTEIIALVVIVTLFFGSKIAVSLGKAAGETFRELRKIKDEFTGNAKEKSTKKA